jgi:hypothetical protein
MMLHGNQPTNHATLNWVVPLTGTLNHDVVLFLQVQYSLGNRFITEYSKDLVVATVFLPDDLLK